MLCLQEQWKSIGPAAKRKDRSHFEDEEGGHNEKRRKKGGKRRKRDKGSKTRYETNEAEADIVDDHEELDDEDGSMNYRDPSNPMNDQEDEGEEKAQDLLAAAGLEDSEAEDDVVIFLYLPIIIFWEILGIFILVIPILICLGRYCQLEFFPSKRTNLKRFYAIVCLVNWHHSSFSPRFFMVSFSIQDIHTSIPKCLSGPQNEKWKILSFFQETIQTFLMNHNNSLISSKSLNFFFFEKLENTMFFFKCIIFREVILAIAFYPSAFLFSFLFSVDKSREVPLIHFSLLFYIF